MRGQVSSKVGHVQKPQVEICYHYEKWPQDREGRGPSPPPRLNLFLTFSLCFCGFASFCGSEEELETASHFTEDLALWPPDCAGPWTWSMSFSVQVLHSKFYWSKRTKFRQPDILKVSDSVLRTRSQKPIRTSEG